ncbi:amidohydrolase [Enemella dayhoffiae]|nr:amidohydrolase [Enemella dayhoffiae]
MAVRDGQILAVGEPGQVAGRLPAGTPVLDCGRQAVMPGFIDSHHHLLWTGMAAVRVDLGAADSIAELSRRLTGWADQHPHREWVVSAEGWEVADLAERRYPTRFELDRCCPGRPVYLPRGGHAGVANSVALARAGISDDTPDPRGGIIERDHTGAATGLLLERARDLVATHVPPPTLNERLDALDAAQQTCLGQGITRILDPGLTHEEVDAYLTARDSGRLRLRASLLGLVTSGPDAVAEAASFLPLIRDPGWDDRLRLCGLKVFVDGGGSLGTAWLTKEYPGLNGYHGERLIEKPDLDALLAYAAEHGVPVGAHTVGDAAIDAVLTSIAGLSCGTDLAPGHFSLIHAYLWPSTASLGLAAERGVAVAAQPGMYARFAETLAQRFGWSATEAASPLRSWLEAGVILGGGSDSPVTTSSPLGGIHDAVTRDHKGRVLGPGERLDRQQAVEMYAGGAALIAQVGGQEGILRPGARADWVVLEGDPLTCRDDELPGLEVLATAVAGEIVHRSPGWTHGGCGLGTSDE